MGPKKKEKNGIGEEECPEEISEEERKELGIFDDDDDEEDEDERDESWRDTG